MNDTHPVVLPCGAVLGDLLEQVAEGHGDDRSSHQRSCLHCRGRLDRLARVWSDIERMRDDRPTVPPAFVDRVMARVEADHGSQWWLPTRGPGTTTTRLGVVEVVVVSAARTVADVVRVVGCAVDVEDASVRLDVVAAVSGRSLHEIGTDVRAAVLVDADDLLGRPPSAVHVHVVDVTV